ncbi:MAG: alpha-L-rhamnosidase C-terminal domain-containing protein [Prevotellaceae bacterium]|nr:alpha-L-rhamnosidase C-terminal domain-containing protein [Prevotellaceae bacterium]
MNKPHIIDKGIITRIAIIAVIIMTANISNAQKPIRLTTDLIEHTDIVYVDGYPSTMTLDETKDAIENWQTALVRSEKPCFGWVMTSQENNTMQMAYRVLVASSMDLLNEDDADMWDSGLIESDNSSNVVYQGKPLRPSTIYYWKVKTWDNHGSEPIYSDARAFMTAKVLDNGISRYPLEKTDEYAKSITVNGKGNTLLDFGNDAFAQLSLTLTGTNENDTVDIHLGEVLKGTHVNRKPDGSQRYALYRLPLTKGTKTYKIKLRKDRRNTAPKMNESGVDPIFMPDYIGEVYPFRYCEIENYSGNIGKTDIVRHSVHYPFNDNEAYFHSSDSVLNMIWELCKHTVKATSFCGTYVDGDRERIPYEADAIINQLSHYAVDREFSMARHSINHLVYNPTWPTEWILQTVIMAWNEYMYTGDNRLLTATYEDLKAKTLLALREENGLISTRTGKTTPDVYKSIHFKGARLKDIVDWPQTGAEGIEKENGGEADGFVFTDYNTVVNAYHYKALTLIAEIAKALGKNDDASLYTKEAERVKKTINALLTEKKTGLYIDGIDTNHKSLHSNMFALDFGLATKKNKANVIDFIKNRKMACSVYGAQFLLDALYDNEEAEYALSLLNSTSMRSWYNMLRIGSTITTEAWDNVFKLNQDWNHPWGAAPANVIARKLMGIEPLEPGFSSIRIKPQPASLRHASITLPTIKGTIAVTFDNDPNNAFTMTTTIPANTTAEIWLPKTKNSIVFLDNSQHSPTLSDNYIKICIGSGKHTIEIRRK